MSEPLSPASLFSGTTSWARSLETPLRQFVRTETGSAAILLIATLAALGWANFDASGYEAWWHTELSIHAGTLDLTLDLRKWVNSGLMAFFFLVAGLEARREFDMGELRERRRLALPLVAGLGGMIVPIAIYLAINVGQGSAHGWGAAMSTDTAFALGMLALVGRHLPDRVRTYLLTFAIVDDLVGIAIIAFVYSGPLTWPPLVVGVALLLAALVLRRWDLRSGPVYALLGVGAWVAFFKADVDPIVVGLLIGLATEAYPAARRDLELATEVFRRFREQPTAELAQSARDVVRTAISPNARLQQIYHPWTSYVIVPLFALANAGVSVSGATLGRAFTSPITWGILIGYVVGKPIGTVGSAWLLQRLSRGGIRPPVGWAAVTGRRDHRRDRVHGVPADLLARLPRPGAGGGQDRHPVGGPGRVRHHLAGVPGHRAAPPAAAGPGPAGHGRDDRRPGRAGGDEPRPRARARRSPR